MVTPADEGTVAKLLASVGKEIVYRAPEEFGRAAFRKYALALGDFNPLYLDRRFARRHGLRDVMAPPTLLCDTWQYIDGDMDDLGDLLGRREAREFNGLRAGNDYEFFQPVHPSDVVTARWRIKDVYEREGRYGRLLFQEVEISFYNQRKELLTRNTEIMFYRLKTTPAASAAS